jgi:hypothetical protein
MLQCGVIVPSLAGLVEGPVQRELKRLRESGPCSTRALRTVGGSGGADFSRGRCACARIAAASVSQSATPNASAISSRLWLIVILRPLAARATRSVRAIALASRKSLLERNRSARACVADPFVRAKGYDEPRYVHRTPRAGRKRQVVSIARKVAPRPAGVDHMSRGTGGPRLRPIQDTALTRLGLTIVLAPPSKGGASVFRPSPRPPPTGAAPILAR